MLTEAVYKSQDDANTIKINYNNCYARKNQTTGCMTQCPFKKKFGNFCGKHRNYLSKNLIPVVHCQEKTQTTTTQGGNTTNINTQIPNNLSDNIDNGDNTDSANNNNNNKKYGGVTTGIVINGLNIKDIKDCNSQNIEYKNIVTLKKIIKDYNGSNPQTASGDNGGNGDSVGDVIDEETKEEEKSKTKATTKAKKLSLKNKNSTVNPFDYYKYNNKYLTILDYLYDKTLKTSQLQLKNSFNHYKLNKFYNTKNINKDDINKFYKTKLSSLFETVLLSYINIEKITKLQKVWRQTIINSKIKIHGPAFNNKSLCNNDTDFYNFDPITEIPDKYFFSFMDEDSFIYGFHVESFINLIASNVNIVNPYNRVKISRDIKDKARYIWSKLNKNKEQSNYVSNIRTRDIKTRVKNKCINALQKIDMFGYQTNIDWIMNLSLNRCRNFFKSIKAYWEYKAGLCDNVKGRIVPFGNPFLSINRNKIYNINKFIVLETILDLINIIISSGVADDDKNQGCILVLMALNEVNADCGRSNNWLM